MNRRARALPAVLALTALATLTACSSENAATPAPSTSAAASPAAASGISQECRNWIEKELLDSSEDIEASSGYAVCGHLTDAELDQAIEDTTNGLMDSSAKPTQEPQKTEAETFQACVAENGTPTEKDAAKHVTKAQGTEDRNNILDSADVYTDYTGDMFGPHQGEAKLIASAFASCYESDNGLVTVYSKDGEMLANGNF